MRATLKRVANFISWATSQPEALPVAIIVVCLWTSSGLGTDTINYGLSVVTFLMFFPVKYSQSRDTTAEHKKLDSLVINTPADSKLAGIEKEEEGGKSTGGKHAPQ